MKIYEFKIGDTITRVQPAKSIGYTTDMMTGVSYLRPGDRSYMGKPLTFKGIANGMIYIKSNDPFDKILFEDSEKLSGVALDLYEDGWEYYVDPNSLDTEISTSDIEKSIEKAIEDEDYELAEKLKSKLNKNK